MLKAAENMRGKSALLYRVTRPLGHRLHIFLNSAYEQKTGCRAGSASLQEEVETQVVTGTFHVLAEQLRATLAIFRLRGEISLTKK